jgi:Flp pilus assembly protein TadG
MRGMRDERGAVAVVVALVMVPLIGFAALGLDVAALWWEKQQLHTGADAAALAIAQDCSRAASTCTSNGAAATAQTLAAGNHPKGAVSATVTSLTSTQVTVNASATRANLFAPVLGARSSTVNASATVAWGAPSGGTAVLPLAFSWCEWQQQTGGALPSGTTSRVIYLTKTSGTTDCTGPSNNIVPGGFGWLTVNSGGCGTTTSIGNIITSDPGNSVPNGCSTSSFSSLVGKTVLLPLFDSYAGSGSGATYRIFGYAAFQLTGYSFGGQYSAGTGTCNGNDRCVKGYFTRFVSLSEAFTYSAVAPVLGASVLILKS